MCVTKGRRLLCGSVTCGAKGILARGEARGAFAADIGPRCELGPGEGMVGCLLVGEIK